MTKDNIGAMLAFYMLLMLASQSTRYFRRADHFDSFIQKAPNIVVFYTGCYQRQAGLAMSLW